MLRLTRREREVLVELCRPLLERAAFREPAATRDIARRLFVTETAVKQHLLRMYEKLAVPVDGNRRLTLANVALELGILSAEELGGSERAPLPLPTGDAGQSDDALALGRAAAKQRAWEAAYARLAEADARGLLTEPNDLAALGEAALWTARHAESISARQRAYAAFAEARDADGAARVAADLFINFIVRGRFASGGGWLAKAKRQLEDRPEARSLGYVAALEALGLLAMGKLDEGAERAQTAMRSGERHGDRDAYTLGQAFTACVLVSRGDAAAAMPLFDEAMATATSGELGTLATGIVYCRTLCTCLDQMDYRRACDWCATIEQSGRTGGGGFPGDCRAHMAAALSAMGEWTRAEAEARAAAEEAMRFDFGHVGLAAYELGMLSLCKGDDAGAEESFRRAHELGAVAEPGLSLLRLARGDAGAASLSIEAALSSAPADPLSRARLLPAKIEIALAAGDREGARAASSELDLIAAHHPENAALDAAAGHGAGLVAAANGAHADAIAHLRRSCGRWLEAGVPFEVARARHDLGVALAATGDRASAALELEAARKSFEGLGDLRRASKAASSLTSR